MKIVFLQFFKIYHFMSENLFLTYKTASYNAKKKVKKSKSEKI